METLWHDTRLALRSYARTPSFFFVTIATLAIGIGATTTIFSVIQGVLLAPLPYDEPARIVEVGKWSPNFDRLFALSAPDVRDVQERNHSFEALAASGLTRLTILGDGEPQILRGAMVFPDFFAVLGVQPTLGRSFTAAEDAAATPVAVLSHALWQRRWGGDSVFVGKTITLNETPFMVVGIMPPDFRPPQAIGQADVELWIPFAFVNEESKNQRRDAFLQVIGRLHHGVSHASAQSELLALSARLTEEFPDAGERSFGLSPLHRETVGGSRGTLLPLFGAVGLLLMIAWTNVANLVLLRASARGREIALRVAIGANRSRIIRQHLTESLMLGLAGGVLGVGIAWVGLRIFVAFDPGDIPRLSEVSVNGSVLGFAVALSVLTSLTVGLVPALRSSRPDLVNGLKEGAKGAGSSLQRERLRNGLVIVETSLAFVLVVGAGLLINSFVRLHRVETGFDPEAIYAISVAYPSDESANVPTFYDEVIRRVDALPGVTAAGATTTLPLSGDRAMQSLTVEGRPVPADEDRYSANYHLVTADFFATLGISLLRGRDFDDSESPTSPPVVVVNEAMTRDLFGDGDPIGRRLSLGERGLKEGWFEIVGVVANIRQMGLALAPVPELYFSFDQIPRRQMHVLARSEVPNPQVLTAMREAVWSVRPDVPIRRSILMSDFAAQSILGPRFYTLLLGSFAVVALLLALVGIYGTLAYTVSQRSHELGVRMALGATGGSVLRMILGRAMALVVFGVILGIGAAVLVTRTLESFVFGVTPTDTTTMALGVATVLVAAFLASVVPAWRATRLDPIVTLGRE